MRRPTLGLVLLAAALAPAAGSADDGPAKTTKKKEEPPPLRGATIDFDYDAKETGHKERAWMGRAFVHATVPSAKEVPLLVFIHGMNVEKIKYRWMGGGTEGDVRRIVSEMIESGQIPPMIVAGPSSIDPVIMANAVITWPAFDIDNFVERTQVALGAAAKIDKKRVIVAGHSGAGCNAKGGIASALLTAKKTTVVAGLVIDVCMGTDLALELAKAPKDTNVVVSWQELSWPNRPTSDFKRVFTRAAKANPPSAGVLRELDLTQPKEPSPHDAMVGVTLRKWLPRFVPKGP